MRILLDCDGVLAHFTKTFLDFCGSAATDEDITQFDIVKALGLPADTYAKFGADVGRLNLCSIIPAYPGAREFVQRLQAKHEVIACTSPFNTDWLSQRGAWLERHVGIPLKQQVQCKDKALIRGDVLIDDSWQNCEAWAEANPSGKTICFSQPWNRKHEFNWVYSMRLDGYEAVLQELRA